MKQLRHVLQFEYLSYIKSKSFIVITIIMVLAAFIVPSIPTIMAYYDNIKAEDSKSGESMAVYDPAGHYDAALCQSYLSAYQFATFGTEQAALDAVTDGQHRYALVFDESGFTLYISSLSLSQFTIQSSISNMVRNERLLMSLENAGMDAAEAGAVVAFWPTSQIVTLDASTDGDAAANYQENIIYAYVMVFILYFSLVLYGQYILVSVVREKATKTMELLITSCKSIWLINGKVLGVGLAGLTQLAFLIAAALVSMRLNEQWLDAIAGAFLVNIKPAILLYMVIFFVLGFFALAYVNAALASTVSRMEDASTVATVPMLLIVVGFFAAIMGMASPNVLWVKVLSFVPFLSPMVMFMRICVGSALIWEAWVSIGIQAVVIVITGFLAARIYRMCTLMYGKQPNIRTLAAMLVGRNG